jgi:hypothetical protein
MKSYAIGFLNFASTFKEAADLLLANRSRELETPSYYLLCHSVELALKAFLKTKGFSDDLMKSKELGHNLTRLMDESLRHGLADVVKMDDTALEIIHVVDEYYRTKGFEYLLPGFKTYPRLEDLEAVVKKLITEIGPWCTGHTASEIKKEREAREKSTES